MNEMQLATRATPPTIHANFEEIKQHLAEEVRKYDVILTEETVKDGKKMAADLNKIKRQIRDAERAALEQVLAPVDEFKGRIKELLAIVDSTRERITSQVKKFEEQRLQEIEAILHDYVTLRIQEMHLEPPFDNIEWRDLVKLTAITKKGAPTAATVRTIEDRIQLRVEQAAAHAEQERLRKEAEEARIQAEVARREEAIRQQALEEAKKEQECAPQPMPTPDTLAPEFAPTEPREVTIPLEGEPAPYSVWRIALEFDVKVDAGTPQQDVTDAFMRHVKERCPYMADAVETVTVISRVPSYE